MTRSQLTYNGDGKSGEHRKVTHYKPGDKIFYKSPKSTLPNWISARIVKRLSPLVYLIKIENGNTRLAHGFQIKPKIERNLKYFVPNSKCLPESKKPPIRFSLPGARSAEHPSQRRSPTRIVPRRIPADILSDEEVNIGWETPPPFRFSLPGTRSAEHPSSHRRSPTSDIPGSLPQSSPPSQTFTSRSLRPRHLIRRPRRLGFD